MYNLVISNVYKGFKSRTFRLLFVVSVVCATLTMFMANKIATGNIDTSVANIMFLFSDASMLALLGAILATTLIGAEFETKFLHHAIVARFSRLQIVIGKAITYWLFFIILMSPYIVLNIIAVLFDWSVNIGIPTLGFLYLYGQEESTATKLTLIAVLALVYIAQLSFTILLAFLFKRAMLVIPIFYTLSALSGQVSANADVLKVANDVLGFTPFGGEIIALTTDSVGQAVFVSLLFMVIIVVLTFIAFRKAEVK